MGRMIGYFILVIFIGAYSSLWYYFNGGYFADFELWYYSDKFVGIEAHPSGYRMDTASYLEGGGTETFRAMVDYRYNAGGKIYSGTLKGAVLKEKGTAERLAEQRFPMKMPFTVLYYPEKPHISVHSKDDLPQIYSILFWGFIAFLLAIPAVVPTVYLINVFLNYMQGQENE